MDIQIGSKLCAKVREMVFATFLSGFLFSQWYKIESSPNETLGIEFSPRVANGERQKRSVNRSSNQEKSISQRAHTNSIHHGFENDRSFVVHSIFEFCVWLASSGSNLNSYVFIMTLRVGPGPLITVRYYQWTCRLTDRPPMGKEEHKPEIESREYYPLTGVTLTNWPLCVQNGYKLPWKRKHRDLRCFFWLIDAQIEQDLQTVPLQFLVPNDRFRLWPINTLSPSLGPKIGLALASGNCQKTRRIVGWR